MKFLLELQSGLRYYPMKINPWRVAVLSKRLIALCVVFTLSVPLTVLAARSSRSVDFEQQEIAREKAMLRSQQDMLQVLKNIEQELKKLNANLSGNAAAEKEMPETLENELIDE